MQTQTDSTLPLNVTVRFQNEACKCNLIEPHYLEGLSLLMSENLSASEAICAINISDTVIWGQVRYLPLGLDKSYMKAYKKLKKLRSQSTQQSVQNVCEERDNDVAANTTGDVDLQNEISVEDDALRTIMDSVSEDKDNLSPEIRKLKEFVCGKIQERQDDQKNTLPDVHCVRHNHNLLAVYCEGKVAEELVLKKGFIMPDGTSRQGVGDIAATVARVGDKFRALKTVKITKGTTNNWANAVTHVTKISKSIE